MWAPTLAVSLREIASPRDEEAAPVGYQRPAWCKVDRDPLTFGLSQQGHKQNIIILLSDPSSKHRRALFEKLHFCVEL